MFTFYYVMYHAHHFVGVLIKSKSHTLGQSKFLRRNLRSEYLTIYNETVFKVRHSFTWSGHRYYFILLKVKEILRSLRVIRRNCEALAVAYRIIEKWPMHL